MGRSGNFSEELALKVQQLAVEYEQVQIALKAERGMKSTPPFSEEIFSSQSGREDSL